MNAKFFLCRKDFRGAKDSARIEKDQHRTSNVQHRMMNKKTNVKQRTVIENILEKTEELIKIFVANIKTAEKK